MFLIPSVNGFLTFTTSFVDIYMSILSILGNSVFFKSFDNDTIKYYIGLSDLNSGSNTERIFGGREDKCKTQLEICTL